MIDYRFKCPECGDFRDIEERKRGVLIITPVSVEDYGSGPELYSVDGDEEIDDYEATVEYVCADCGWALPCSDPKEVVDFIVDQEIDRRY